MVFIFFVLISFGVVVLLKFCSFIVSERAKLTREELGCYECGFEQNNLSRIPFSMRYFFLTLIFLLFDLEIVFLLFIIYFIFSGYFFYGLIVFIFFVVVLFMGLVYEWLEGSLEWLS